MNDTAPNPDDDGMPVGAHVRGSRLFQIRDDDLSELTQLTARVLDDWIFEVGTTPLNRRTYTRIRDILSDVRFNYGPPTYIEKIPCDGLEPGSDEPT